jgi:MFS family permease
MGSRLRFGLQGNALLIFWAMFCTQAAWGFSDRFRPLFVESLGAGPALVGIVIGSGELLRLLGLALAGPLNDRLPTRLLIAGGRGVIVVVPLIYVFAQEWWQLIPALLIGAFANVAWPAVSRVLAEATDTANRARAFVLIYSVAPGAALLLSPLIGGLVAEAVSMRAIFLMTSIGLAGAAFFFWLIRPVELPRSEQPAATTYRDVLRERPIMLLCGLQALLMFTMWTGLTLAPNYLQDLHDVSLRTIGQLGSVLAVGSIGAAIAISRVGWLRQTTNAMLATVAFTPLVFALLLGGSAAWAFAAAYLLWGVAAVATQMFYAAVSEVTPDALRTRAFAVLEVLGGGAIALAGFAAGGLYRIDPELPLWVGLVGSVGLIVAVLAARRLLAVWTAQADAEPAPLAVPAEVQP